MRGWENHSCMRKKRCDNMDWFHLAQDWEQQQALVSIAMPLQVPYKAATS